MKKCSICNKNIAVLYAAQMNNGKSEMQGICLECAKKMGIPLMDQLMQQTGMTPEEMENLNDEMNDMFEDMNFDIFEEKEKQEDNQLSEFVQNIFSVFKTTDQKEEGPTKQSSTKQDSTKQDSTKKEKNISKPKSKGKRKYLDTYGMNLTEKAQNGQVDPVIGREQEIDRVIQILNRRTKNNPVLIGEPGVGKTAIAEGLAVKIVEKQVPEKLFDMEIYLLDLTGIVAGTQFRGQFEARMKSIINEAQENENIILVIDELHNIMGAGEVHGGVMNAANILKPALARGEIQIIGATTLEEYRKYIEKDGALERRFQPVQVQEPTIDQAIEMLKGIRHYYEDYHKVQIPNETVEAAVKLSERYISDRFLPDKAIDIIDEAGSRVNLANKNLIKMKKLTEELDTIQDEKDKAAVEANYEKAAQLKVQEYAVMNQLEVLEKQNNNNVVTQEDVAAVIETWTKIPVQSISESEAQKLLYLEERLHHRVIGQHPAVQSVAKAIRRSRSGLKRKNRPASFIFVGPTGVGKTELVRALAQELFGSQEEMIRVDMSEFMEKHTVSKLIGAPPGYVGYDQGGQLSEKVRRKPYSVVLFDEIEKAHPDVFNLLLQILEDGIVTDAQGRIVHFENTVIIMTSNAGTHLKSYGMGFGKEVQEVMEAKIKETLQEVFRPEFLNRIDEIIVFNRLMKEELREIINLMLKEIAEEVEDKHITFDVTEEVKDFILQKGYDIKYGARPLRRTIQKYIEDPLAELYIKNRIKPGMHIKISLSSDEIDFNII